MSRIGKKPIIIPTNVKAKVEGLKILMEGPKGKLTQEIHPRIKVVVEQNQIKVSRPTNVKTDRSLHGLTRSLIQNMVQGVVEGYKKELEIEGVGYKATVKGNVVSLALGFTHPIDYQLPAGIEVKCAKPTQIAIMGLDKQVVGQVAADIRHFAEPEPYKGKGIHYVGEHIRRKQGKTVG